MKMKKRYRFLSFLLAVLLCMQMGTSMVFARSETEQPTEQAPPQLVGELQGKRTENEKYFLYDDQSVVAAVYPQTVHYQDEQGDWQEVDNRLTQTGSGEDAVLENGKNTWKIKFAKKAKDGKLATLQYKGHNIKWHLSGADKTTAKAYKQSSPSTDDELMLNDINGGMVYADILPAVDLEYLLSGDQIKENIILQDVSAVGEYTFIYQTGKLEMIQQGEQLVLCDNDQPLLTIDAPLMSDAAGAQSDAITLSFQTLKATGGNHMYAVTVSPDVQWLTEKERQFPVKIDPTTSTELNNQKIFDTYVSKANPTTNYNGENHVRVGMYGSSDVYRTYIKFSLPKNIGTSDRVIQAYLNLHPDPVISQAGWNDLAQQLPVIEAHAPTEYWNISTINWNNQPNVDSTVLDYDIIRAGDAESAYRIYSWDISSLVDDWYTSGNNHGVMLKYDSETEYSGNRIAKFCSGLRTGFENNKQVYPVVHFRYINMLGLEDYWTYHSLDAGVGGTAYINDFTGGLTVVTPLASVASEIMPLNLSLVYSEGSNNETVNKLRPGAHFMLSAQSYIQSVTINGTQRYKFVDGDGTIHYFEQVDGVWKDDGGHGWTLTLENGFKITDKQDNVTRYNAGGCLTKYTDNRGNSITYSYDSSGYLQTISNGTHTIRLERDGNYLRRVWYPAPDGKQQYMQFTYSSINTIDRLTQYVPYGTGYRPTHVASFLPVEGGTLLKHIVSCPFDEANPPENSASVIHGTALSFGYNNQQDNTEVRRRVNFYKNRAYQNNQVFGAQEYEYEIRYQDGATRYIQRPENQGLTTELYTFDTMGRTITAQDQDGNALFSRYGMSGGAENKVTFSSSSQRVTTNLVKNHNFEKHNSTALVDWVGYGNAGDTFTIQGSYQGSEHHIGENALRVYKNNASENGDANAAQHLYVPGGKKYTLSVYVRTAFTQVDNVAGAGVHIGLQNLDIPFTNYESGMVSVGKFTRYYVTADLTNISGTCLITVVLGIRRAKGIAYFDCVQLEEGSVANSYNLMENGGFENAADTTTWVEENTGDVDGRIVDIIHSGGGGFKFTGNPKWAKRIYQDINVSGEAGTSLTAGAWVKADTVPDKDTNLDGTRQTCAMTLRLWLIDDTYQYITVPITTANDHWRYICFDGVASKKFLSARLYIKYAYNCNAAFFDDVCLYVDTLGQSFVYDENGNVKSVVDRANTTSNLSYSTVNEMTEYTDGKGKKYTFTYDTTKKHQLTKITNPDGSKEQIGYNSYGNPVSSRFSGADGVLVQTTQTTYTADGHHVQSQTGTDGETTYYTRDAGTGRLQTVAAPLAQGKSLDTSYEYDTLTQGVTKVSTQTQAYTLNNGTRVPGATTAIPTNVTYDYDHSNLVQINRNADQTKQMGYHMVYDVFGKRTGVAWSGKNNIQYSLQTTQYDPLTSLPQSVTYGNAQTVGYTYNKNGAITSRTYNGNTLATYEYNIRNQLGASTYLRAHTNAYVTKRYDYDLAGRISRTRDSLGHYSSHITYDANNNVTHYTTGVDDDQVTIGHEKHYTYNDMNLLTSMQIEPIDGEPAGTMDYYYDSIHRLARTEIALDANKVNKLTTEQNYMLNASGGRTMLPNTKHVHGSLNGAGFDVSYKNTYYPDSSIASQTATEYGKDFIASYDYDDLGQITTVTNSVKENNVTTQTEQYNYTYDHGGNLLTKSRTATEGGYTAAYTYDGNMSDLLTGFTKTAADGTVTQQTYNYLASNGNLFVNPTTIVKSTNGTVTDTWNLTWEQGRQLSSITSAAGMVKYEYNDSGLRTYKQQADGTVHYYYYDGDRLDYLKVVNSSGTLTGLFHFVYDSYGQVQYILRKHNYLPNLSANYDLYHVVRDNAGAITKLLKVRGGTSNSSTYVFVLVAEYEYDPFGKPTVKTYGDSTATLCPFLYKDYIYDFDTGLYYLQSRYYDPEVGRFINGDRYASTGQGIADTNTFSYCLNNPIKFRDHEGTRPVVGDSVSRETQLERKLSTNFMKQKEVTYVDITNELDIFMFNSCGEFEDYIDENGSANGAFFFAENVTDGGVWDIKRNPDWNLSPNRQYVYNGRVLRYDDPGNIAYGYIGGVLFSEEVLCMAAGANQITKYGFKCGHLLSYFDDPRDQQMIRFGYSLYPEK